MRDDLNIQNVDSPIRNPQSPIRNLRLFAADIKLSHTLFALPFALLATFLAAAGLPYLGQLALIVLCMITARTVAMASNRLLDADLDAQNPRTATRAIPSGALSQRFYTVILAACAVAFILTTAGFWFLYQNPWPLILSIPVLAFISAYPFLKRFTKLCHYYLGAALALAPLCAWIAIAGTLAWPAVLMSAAVLLWTAGFDIIYACQDYHSDLETGTFSIPARLGIAPALWVSRLTHAACIAMLIALALSTPLLGTLFAIGIAAAIALLITEHVLVRPHDLSKVNLAFFTLNGIISLLLATLGIIDVFI
jgi:4-hydroxybenzoate polyprenyltransferase